MSAKAESKLELKTSATTNWDAEEKIALTNIISAADHDEKAGWVFYSEMSTGIKVYTRENPDGSAHAVCGTGLIEASPERVLAEVANTENWKNWDSLMDRVEYTKLNEKHKIYHLIMHGVWPIWPRDLVYFELSQKLEDGSLVLATTGVNFDKYPEQPDQFVRAHLKCGGWHVRPVKGNPNQCIASYTMNIDIKMDMIPTWLMNWVVTRFPGIIDKVRDGIAGKAKPAEESAEERAAHEKEKSGEKAPEKPAGSTSWHGLW